MNSSSRPGISVSVMGDMDAPVVRIRAVEDRALVSLLWMRLSEVWEYRELLFFLVWRDVKVRYKQTVLGGAWALVQPLLTMAVFSIFLGALVRVPSDGIPYPIFVYCGLVPWQLFAFALSSSANSLITNDRLLTKVYFPRLVLPISSVLSGVLDFALAFVVLLLMMAYYGISPTGATWTLPAFVLLAVVAAIAVGTGLSALNVRFRDVRHTLPFITQLWLLATPIAYPSSLVPEAWRPLYGLNPMTGVVEGFRWALLGRVEPLGLMFFGSIVMVLVVLIVSFVYFLRVEVTFADRV